MYKWKTVKKRPLTVLTWIVRADTEEVAGKQESEEKPPTPPPSWWASLHHLGVHHPVTPHRPHAPVDNRPRVQTQRLTGKSEFASLLVGLRKDWRWSHLSPCSCTRETVSRAGVQVLSGETFELDQEPQKLGHQRCWLCVQKCSERIKNCDPCNFKFFLSTFLFLLSTVLSTSKTSEIKWDVSQSPGPQSRQQTAPSQTAGLAVGGKQSTKAVRQEEKQ